MPDYDPHEYPERWLIGACSSGDLMRWAVVEVAAKIARLEAVANAAIQYRAMLHNPLGGNVEALEDALDALKDTSDALPTNPTERCPDCDYPGGEPEPVRCPTCGH